MREEEAEREERASEFFIRLALGRQAGRGPKQPSVYHARAIFQEQISTKILVLGILMRVDHYSFFSDGLSSKAIGVKMGR